MRKAFIACGGTGGHLSPGIALAEELASREWACTLLISKKQVDSRLVEKYSQFEYEALSGSPFALRPLRFVRFLGNLARGTLKCYLRIRKEKPDVVIGFGGFLSMPAMLAGRLHGLPTVIHEANRIAGRVTRMVGPFARRIYLPEGVSIRTARSSRIRHLGMPVRREIQPISKPSARSKLGLHPNTKTLLIMGGSQGAESLNRWAEESLPSLAQEEIQVICLTGGGGEDASFSFCSPKGQEVRSVFRRFSDDMATILSAADLAVTRSGAGSLAEMTRCRLPGILIPYPHSADDHQIANARNFESLGCGVQISQKGLENLLEEVKAIISDEGLLGTFQANLERADRTDVPGNMAQDIEEIVSGRRANLPEQLERGAHT